ncbi:MAG: DUF5658 family protein [Acidobacteria bacterium]|nr:DUF5658 family protein [Acidobacteriota bacterium]
MSTSYGKLLWAAAFAALSLLDLYLTWLLIEHTGGCIFEANPFAASVLDNLGWWGLGGYKLACTSTVLVLTAVVSRYRPRLGRLVLVSSVWALVGVTGYSLSLWASPAWASEELRDFYALQAQSDALEQERLDVQLYAHTSMRLANELAQGQTSLARATEELKHHLAELSYDPLKSLRFRYPGLSDDACLAASLVRGATANLREEAKRCDAQMHRIAEQFQSCYRAPLPAFAQFQRAGPHGHGPFPPKSDSTIRNSLTVAQSPSRHEKRKIEVVAPSAR